VATDYNLTAVLNFRNKMSAKMQKAIGQVQKFKQNTDKAKNAVEQMANQSSRISRLSNAFHNLGSSVRQSMSTSPVNNLISRLTALAAAVGGVSAAAGFLKQSLGGAMKLEQEQIAIEHFLGLNNAKEQVSQLAQDFIDYLRKNANITPFETDEVIAAGRRAINISTGDVDLAKQLLTIAEDMAALNPGKSIMDAMEALADLKVGETERMKEFGFKISQETLKQLGGGDVEKGAMKLMTTDIAKTFEGGAAKLGKSAAGVISTITGSISSSFTDMGIGAMEKLKPQLQVIADFVNSKTFEDWVGKGADLMTKLAEKVIAFGDYIIKNAPKWIAKVKQFYNQIKPLLPFIKNLVLAIGGLFVVNKVFSTISAGLMLLTNPLAWVVVAIALLATAWQQNWFGMRDHVKAFIEWVKPYIDKGVQFITNTFNRIKEWMSTDGKALLDPIVNNVRNVIDRVRGWMNTEGKAFLTPIVDGIRDTVAGIKPVLKTAWDVVQQLVGFIISKIPEVAPIFMDIFGKVKTVVMTVLPPVFNLIRTIISTIVSVVQTLLPYIVPVFKWVFNTAVTVIKEAVNFIWPIIQNYLIPAFMAIVDAAQKIFQFIQRVFPYIAKIIAFAMSIIIPIVEFAATFIWNTIKTAFTFVLDIVSWAMNTVWNVIKTIWNFISGIFETFLKLITGDFAGAWESFKNTVVETFNAVWELIDEFVQGAIRIGKNFIDNIVEGFLSVWDKLKNTAKKIWDSVTGIFGKKKKAQVEVSAEETDTKTTQTTVTASPPYNPPGSGYASWRSHAGGLDFVPYDGYAARLHRGEAILTPEENRARNRGGNSSAGAGSGGKTEYHFHLNYQGTSNLEADAEALLRIMARKIQQAGGQMAHG